MNIKYMLFKTGLFLKYLFKETLQSLMSIVGIPLRGLRKLNYPKTWAQVYLVLGIIMIITKQHNLAKVCFILFAISFFMYMWQSGDFMRVHYKELKEKAIRRDKK